MIGAPYSPGGLDSGDDQHVLLHAAHELVGALVEPLRLRHQLAQPLDRERRPAARRVGR